MQLELITEFEAHPRHAQAVTFAPDGREVVTTGMDALAQIWSVPDFVLLRTFDGHAQSVNCAVLTPDGRQVITGSTDRTAIVWDWRTCEPIVRLPGHRNTLAGAAFSPTGDLAVTASYDGRIGFWQAGAETLDIVKAHPKNVTTVTFSPDGSALASAGIGNIVKIWDVESRAVVREIEAPGQAATGCVFRPSGELFCWTYEGHLLTLSADSYEPAARGQMSGGAANSVSVVPGRGLLFCSVAGGVRLLDAETFETVASAETRIKGMYGVGSSPDGSIVACVSADGRLRAWAIS